MSLVPSSLRVGSPRTLCPRDGDAFSFNPSHLRAWYMPQYLWDHLPAHIQSALTSMQHSGAAVLTGFERLDEHNETFNTSAMPKDVDDELEVQPEDISLGASVSSSSSLASRRPRLPPVRTASDASSRLESMLGSPIFTASPSTVSSVPTPEFTASESKSSVSPMCLTPSALPADIFPKLPNASAPAFTPTNIVDSMLSPASAPTAAITNPGKDTGTKQSELYGGVRKRPCDRGRSFSTPLEPHNAYYASELSHLRTEALPRLRHCARKVDTEFYEVKRLNQLPEHEVAEFETWWASKKAAIRGLDEQGNRLSMAMGIAPTGMGWTAP